MKEILFRGKTTGKDSVWVYGSYITYMHRYGENSIQEHGIVEYFDDKFSINNVIPETVGQYTDWTDDHNNKIFNGDIVKSTVTNYMGQIYWDDNRGGWRIEPIPSSDSLRANLYGCDCLEIIGNIHDNPELLFNENNEKI